jgi:NAD(P)-dependent dehydrogenase (short-subunit alcohol dehydrogenase family)
MEQQTPRQKPFNRTASYHFPNQPSFQRKVIESSGRFARWEPLTGHQESRVLNMGRFGRVQEVAGTVAFLASDDAGYVTASAFPLDGGISVAYTIPSS